MIYTTAYVSSLNPSVSDDEVQELLEASRVRNAEDGVTGLLALRGRRVMQFLEGDEEQVRDLFGRISRDPRHDDVVTVWRSTTETRRFPDWTMGFDDLEAMPTDPADTSWPEPSLPSLPTGSDGPAPRDTLGDYVERRAEVLRRALVSGDRATTSLAIILSGHRPEEVLEDDAVVRIRCAECRVPSSAELDRYPCSTARNAIWALEGVLG